MSGGDSLDASATRQGAALEVTIRNSSPATWVQADAEAVGNSVIASVVILTDDRSVLVTLLPRDPDLDRASFLFKGLLLGYRDGTRCDVSRVLEVVTDGDAVAVQPADRRHATGRRS